MFNYLDLIILAPNFRSTSEALQNPSIVIKAMKKGISIDATIRIQNNSGNDLQLFWVNPEDQSHIRMSEAPLESRDDPHFFRASVYHQFVIKEADAAMDTTTRGSNNLQMDCPTDGDASCTPKRAPQAEKLRYFRVTARDMGTCKVDLFVSFAEINVSDAMLIMVFG